MFTGLIEEVGYIAAQQGEQLTVRCQAVLAEIALGDSMAVDGVCLTVVQFQAVAFTAQVSDETLRRSHLGSRTPGSMVNLERSLRAGGKIGGHFVSGHSDGVGKLEVRRQVGPFWEMTFSAPTTCQAYLAPKGSIAVNGVSLTIASCTETTFTVAVIPYSLEQTNLIALQTGETVNLEGDILAKYVERLLHKKPATSAMDLAFLSENGY